MSLVRPPIPSLDWAHPEAIRLVDAEVAFFVEKRRIRSAKTRREYARTFAAFRAFLARACVPPTVTALTPETLTAYADELESRAARDCRRHVELDHGLTPASVSGYLRPLKTLCRYLVRRGALSGNPFDATIDPLIPAVEDAPFKVARADDVARIFAAIRGEDPLALRDRALVVLDWDTGLRTEELARLALSDLDLGTCTLRIREPKNGRRV
ncbi:MAG TPA: tyrosine-type recombinase/integrase, partial [Candidatus Saccharimonadales bacterium]|nr:tyrosine-type recombinase/integrase [Candidatus Saccharimonadales bacterium]